MTSTTSSRPSASSPRHTRPLAAVLAVTLGLSACSATPDAVDDPPQAADTEVEQVDPTPVVDDTPFDFDPLDLAVDPAVDPDDPDGDLEELDELDAPTDFEPADDDPELTAVVVPDLEADDGSPPPPDEDPELPADLDPCTLLPAGAWSDWLEGPAGLDGVHLEDGEACGYTDADDTVRLAIAWERMNANSESPIPWDEIGDFENEDIAGQYSLWVPNHPVPASSSLIIETSGGVLTLEMSRRAGVPEQRLREGARVFAELALPVVLEDLAQPAGHTFGSAPEVTAVFASPSADAAPPPATLVAARRQLMLWNVVRAPRSVRIRNGACVSSATVRMQEYGVSGITRFKAQHTLRSPNDTGKFFAYGNSRWQFSPSFPDDAQSYFWVSGWSFRHAGGREFKIRVKLVGVRPSLWNRNVVIKSDLQPGVGCALGSDPGPQTPPPPRRSGDGMRALSS